MKNFSIYLVLAVLLTMSLTNSIYAQDFEIPDIPGMEDFDIPSQEEIKAMMESKEVSGKYDNSEHGVEVTFPNGWSGMESDFKEPSTGDREHLLP